MPEQLAFDYLAEVKKRASPHFHTEKVNAAHLYRAMREAVRQLDIVDKMRKAIFYENRTYETGHLEIPGVTDGRSYPNLSPHLIHGILGAACEGGEKLDLLVRAMDGEEFDVVNYVEECGDGFWFDTLGLDAVGHTMEDTMATNIRKLDKRTGAKFSKESFNERDLLTERSVLEDSVLKSADASKVRVQRICTCGESKELCPEHEGGG